MPAGRRPARVPPARVAGSRREATDLRPQLGDAQAVPGRRADERGAVLVALGQAEHEDGERNRGDRRVGVSAAEGHGPGAATVWGHLSRVNDYGAGWRTLDTAATKSATWRWI